MFNPNKKRNKIEPDEKEMKNLAATPTKTESEEKETRNTASSSTNQETPSIRIDEKAEGNTVSTTKYASNSCFGTCLFCNRRLKFPSAEEFRIHRAKCADQVLADTTSEIASAEDLKEIRRIINQVYQQIQHLHIKKLIDKSF